MGVSFFSPIHYSTTKKTQEINTLFSYFLSSKFEWCFFFFLSPIPYSTTKKNAGNQRNQQTLLQLITAMSVSFFFSPIWMSVSFFFLPNLNECFFFFSSNFEWAFLFFFLLQIHYYKHKCGQKEYSVGGVNRRKKRTARQSPITCHDNNSKKSILVTLAFLLRQVWFACPIDCLEKKKKQFTQCKRSCRRTQPKKRKQHCCPQL